MDKKIHSHSYSFEVKEDKVIQGPYLAKALSPVELISNYPNLQEEDDFSETPGIQEKGPEKGKEQEERVCWKLSKDISGYPSYASDQLLVDALYNMSMEELVLNTETDGTFRTGAIWEGVWTRDISYSILLSLAFLQPEISKTSLRKKVKNQRIIQDTGTGGAYPVSTDRVVWVIAAWEIYLVTGDREWLEEIYPIVKGTLEDDMFNAFDPTTHLVKGESSFLDWREQSYPDWMQPVDIYESETLGTSAVHYKAQELLSVMAEELNQPAVAEKHKAISESIKQGINQQLWVEKDGYYGQYLYGRHHKILSPRAEALGESLAVLYDIAEGERQNAVVSNTPVTRFGIPSIFPQIPSIPPYHNDGIWPFVQAFWSLAAAKVENEAALTQSLDALYRAAGLFLTNKENLVADTGDFQGTVKNSDRQLWSVAGNLGMVFKVFFGMVFEKDRLVLKPFVPKKYEGNKKITGFKYRDCVLDLELEGYGCGIQTVELDGEPITEAVIPADLTGKHHLFIKIKSENDKFEKINLIDNNFSPKTPKVKFEEGKLKWDKQDWIEFYQVLRNGKPFEKTSDKFFSISEKEYGEYQVFAVDPNGIESFTSEPIIVTSQPSFELDISTFTTSSRTTYPGYSGKGYAHVDIRENCQLDWEVNPPEPGIYALTVRYSNGNGPINTDNCCALRTLRQEGEFIGTLVFPQRGGGNWEDWGNSNTIEVNLKEGINAFSITLEPHNVNMNGEINEALLDRVQLTKIENPREKE